MESDIIYLIAVIVIFSVVQSVIGVGLLLFGTPTLLLLGYSFEMVLITLLPSSIVISLLQVASDWRLIGIKRDIIIYTLPMVVIGLVFVLYIDSALHYTKQIVGGMLLLIGLLRVNEQSRSFFEGLLNKNTRLYCSLMGLIHGVSNMGGSFLTIFMGARADNTDVIRTNIGFGYLLFAMVQLMILTAFNPNLFRFDNISLVLISVFIFLLSRNTLMKLIPKNNFQNIITIFIFSYGIISLYS